MLIEILGELSCQFLLDRAFYLARNQLFLRLRGELRIRDLDRNDRDNSLPRVVTGRRDLVFLRETLAVNVLIERPRQRASETRDMGPTITLGDIIRVGEHLLLEAIVPLHGDFNADAVCPQRRKVNHLVQRRLVLVQVIDERP